MGKTTIIHIRSSLILLLDGDYTSEEAAEILVKELECVSDEFCNDDWRGKFYEKLRELLNAKIQ
jgi:hypothetical protein